MIQEAWNSFLEFISQFVIPDWGGLIGLLPLFVLIVVVLFFARMIYVYATIGPSRVREPRRNPLPPAGVHLPGPTWSPILVAIGLFFLFGALVFGGVWIVIGIVSLVLSLLFWGRESEADYDHIADTYPQPVVTTHEGPPPGVHVPGPTFRPFLVSLGLGLFFAGLVFGGWLLLIGIVFTVATLLGWLNDARKEYRHVVNADQTGHIENLPAPAWPKRLLWSMAILLVVAIVLDQGWLPPRSATGGGEPGGSPAPSAAPSGPAGPPGAITIVAKDVKFDQATVNAPAAKPFQITLDNQDAGTPHDVDIVDETGAKVFDGQDFPGVAVETYDVPSLEAGSYQFLCSIHPALMIGDLVAGP